MEKGGGGGDSNDRRAPPPPVPSPPPPVLNRQAMETGENTVDLPPSPQPPPIQEMETGGVSDDQPPPPPSVLNGEEDTSSEACQRLSWEILCKGIKLQVNRVADIANGASKELEKQAAHNIYSEAIWDISFHLFSLDLVRGRGILCSSLITQQEQYPEFTDIYAALAARVNCEFPEIGNLLVRRLIASMKSAYTKQSKTSLLDVTKFIAHLVNQRVVDEPNVLLILDNCTLDNVEVAARYLMECGKMLQDRFPGMLDGSIGFFRDTVEKLDQNKHETLGLLITHLLSLYKDKFEGFYSIRPGLYLMGPPYTHSIKAQDKINPERCLDVFKQSESFLEDEEAFKERRRQIQDRVTEQRRHSQDYGAT